MQGVQPMPNRAPSSGRYQSGDGPPVEAELPLRHPGHQAHEEDAHGDHEHAQHLGQDVPVRLERVPEVAEQRPAGDEHGGEAEDEEKACGDHPAAPGLRQIRAG